MCQQIKKKTYSRIRVITQITVNKLLQESLKVTKRNIFLWYVHKDDQINVVYASFTAWKFNKHADFKKKTIAQKCLPHTG